MSDIKTTSGERFTQADSAKLAFMIFRRFGRDYAAGAVAWRRLLQNSATDADFQALVEQGEAVTRHEFLSYNPYQDDHERLDNR